MIASKSYCTTFFISKLREDFFAIRAGRKYKADKKKRLKLIFNVEDVFNLFFEQNFKVAVIFGLIIQKPD